MAAKVRRAWRGLCWVAFLHLIPLASGRAQVLSWTNTVGGLWDGFNNWSPEIGVAFTRYTAIYVTNVTTKTVTANQSTFSETLTFTNLTLSAPAGSVNTLLLSNLNVTAPFHMLNAFTINS